MNIEKLEQLGAMNYYLDLKKYIMSFVDRNYPLNKKDMQHLINGEDTFNSSKRREIFNVMSNEASNIINQIMKENEQILNNKSLLKNESVEDYSRKIFAYKQQILEKLYYYRNNIENVHSEVIYNNSDNIKSAMENGISNTVISDTLTNMVDKSNDVSRVPLQFKNVVENISKMKDNVVSEKNESYKSNFMKYNSQKLQSALMDGITGDEIKRGFEKEISSGTKDTMKFNTKLIINLHKRELMLSQNKTNNKQFILK